ncbi:MAG: hypothetical protein D6739_04975, partial [Nitrospirae bacterium]
MARRLLLSLLLALSAACHEGADTRVAGEAAAGDTTLQVGLATGSAVLAMAAGAVPAGTVV